MQLGKALLGAIIGAAIGVGLLFVAQNWTDSYWLAIPFALLVGFGVRMMVATAGHASYTRGALTGVIALVAYVGGWFLVAQVAKARAAAAPKPAVVAAVRVADDDAAAGAAAEVPVAEPVRPLDRRMPGGVVGNATPGQNPLDYVWLAIAALVAYELGRGTGGKPVEEAEGPAEPEEPQAAPAE